MRYSARSVPIPLCLLILIAVLLCAGCSSQQNAAPAKPVSTTAKASDAFTPEALERWYGNDDGDTALVNGSTTGSITQYLAKKAAPGHAYSVAVICKPESARFTVSAIDDHGDHKIGGGQCEATPTGAFGFSASQYPTISAIKITTGKDVQTIWTIHEVDHL
jgi:hypothetical protein